MTASPEMKTGSSSGRAPSDRPNILLFISDDKDRRYLGCYGGQYLTPHIDSLAAEGVRFEQAYAVAPACCPCRYSLLTGQYPGRGYDHHASGRPAEPYSVGQSLALDAQSPSIARFLGEAGYYTGFVGKWHSYFDPELTADLDWSPLERDADVDDPEVDRRLREQQAALCEGVKRTAGFDYAAGVLNRNQAGLPDGVTQHNFEYQTQCALDFLDEAAQQDQPWLLWVATTAVHGPDHAEWIEKGDPRYTPGGKREQAPDCLPPRESYRRRLEEAGFPFDSDHVGMLQDDDMLGALLERLRRDGSEKDTLVIYLGDNGVEPGKLTVYQKGVHLPMLARWPDRIEPGSTCEERVQYVDVLPTALDAAGADMPEGYRSDGVSFLPALAGDGLERDYLYFEMLYLRAVLKGRYKYVAFRVPEESIEKMRTGEVDTAVDASGTTSGGFQYLAMRYYPDYYDQDQLYDVEADPFEQENLAEDPALADVLADLKATMQEVLESFDHPYDLSRIDYLDSGEFRRLAEKRIEQSCERHWWHEEKFADWPAVVD